MDFKEMKIVITGASSGLGLAIAQAFADRGSKLAITSNESERLSIVSNELANKASGLLFEDGDLRDIRFIENFAQKVIEKFGWIDILVNNAGIIIPERIGSSSIGNWNAVLDVNLTGPFVLTNVFAPTMNTLSPNPLIINIASLSGVYGSPYCASYVASKFGLVGLTEAINEEFRIHGRLRAIAICPGPINTPAIGPLKSWPGIAPSDNDKVLEPHAVADLIIQLVQISDKVDISRLVLKARKDICLV